MQHKSGQSARTTLRTTLRTTFRTTPRTTCRTVVCPAVCPALCPELCPALCPAYRGGCLCRRAFVNLQLRRCLTDWFCVISAFHKTCSWRSGQPTPGPPLRAQLRKPQQSTRANPGFLCQSEIKRNNATQSAGGEAALVAVFLAHVFRRTTATAGTRSWPAPLSQRAEHSAYRRFKARTLHTRSRRLCSSRFVDIFRTCPEIPDGCRHSGCQ